jgi:hypothetical protein
MHTAPCLKGHARGGKHRRCLVVGDHQAAARVHQQAGQAQSSARGQRV